MQFRIVTLSLLASLVAADSIQDLIAQVPTCTVPCLDNAAKQIGCATTDNQCKCKKSDELASQAIVCVSSSCSIDKLGQTTQLTSEICAEVPKQAGGDIANSAVSSAAAAAATSAISDALDLPSATSTGSAAVATAATATPGAGAGAHIKAGMGLLGAAVVAALAF